MIGNIPKKLKYFSKPLVEIKTEYDDFEIAIGGTQMVKPTFVSDAENEKTCESGKAWAEANYVYDKDTKKWVKNPDYTVESFDNDKITNVKVVSLEKRSQGGRAYKIIIDDVYYVDLREDILLDTILNSGIDVGGKLRGEFIWAKVGSAMKLIRHGSALHEELIKSTEMSILNKIKTLVPGRIYESKTETLIYLGKVDSTDVEIVEDKQQRNYYTASYNNNPVTGHLLTKPVNGMLFYEIRSYDKNPSNIEIHPYRFSIRKSHSLRVDTGIDVEMPDNWLDTLKNNIYKDAVDTANKYPSIKNSKFSEIYYMTQYSDIANIGTMHPAFERALTS